ncbi:hypothetical protein JCM11641_006707 [Rhodosporidiobolus odoratus]
MAYPNPQAQQAALYAASLHQQHQHPHPHPQPGQPRPSLAPHQIQQYQQAQQAQLRAQQAALQANPAAAQQHAQQLRAVAASQAKAQAQAQPAAQAGAAQVAGPSGILARERELGDGDDQARAAKRRKPTSRLLPAAAFVPSLPPSTQLGPTDDKLASSLASLDSLTASYKRLQELERKVDWTISRKKVEVGEAVSSSGGGRGRSLKRTLRVHVTTTLIDQPFQLSPAELEAAGKDVPADPATAGDITVGGAEPVKIEDGVKKEGDAGVNEKPRVPRVKVEIQGEVLDDPNHPHPLSHYLHRLVLESPTHPTVLPQASQPVSWTRSSSGTHPATFTSEHPTSTPLPLRLSLYVAHPAGERFTLMPELAGVLDLAESDRIGICEAVWGYAKERGLVVGPEDGGAAAAGKGGIKTDVRLSRFFGQAAFVPFHLIPEYVNRCIAPATPRVIDFTVDVSPTTSTESHQAFDLSIYVPASVLPALSAASTSLTTLTDGTSSESRELSALDDKIALNCLSVGQRQGQLHLLLAFARDPTGFLAQWVESQAGSLHDILATSSASGGREGSAWKEELRRSALLDQGEWVEEAARVLCMREVEGKRQQIKAEEIVAVKQVQAQQQVMAQQQALLAAQQGGYGRR